MKILLILQTLLLAEYQLTRAKHGRKIKLTAKFESDNFVLLLAYQDVIENEPNPIKRPSRVKFN